MPKKYDPRNTADDLHECMDYDPWNELANRRVDDEEEALASEYDAVMNHSINPDTIADFAMRYADLDGATCPEHYAIGFLAKAIAMRNEGK
jgi:hypothetical protein